MAHIGNTGGLFNRGWEQTSVEFELTTGATVGIGVRGVTPAYHNWMSFSDFRLVQFPGDDTGVDSKEKNLPLRLAAGDFLCGRIIRGH